MEMEKLINVLKKSPHTIEIGFKLKVDHHEELYKS
jgi:hypothetical protein